MKLKKEYLFLVLAIAAVSAYLAMRSDDQAHFELPRMAEVEVADINRLVISKGTNTIELRKKDDQWVVGPKAFPADLTKVKNMTQAAADLTLSAMVSESGNYARYGLTDDQKVVIKAFDGESTLREFTVGIMAPTRQHTFVTLAGDPKVYHARGNLHPTYDRTIEKLRDVTVLSFEKGDIARLDLVKGEQTATFTQKQKPTEASAPSDEKDTESQPQPQVEWLDAQKMAANQADIDRLIGSLSKLRCDGFMEDGAKDGLKDPIWTVTLTSGQTAHTLSVFKPMDEEGMEFLAISSGSPYAFVLSKNRIDTFEKDVAKLLNPEAKQ